MAISATLPSASPPWSELLPDLLGRVIAHLPFPADRSSFRAVCRAWRSAARCHARQLPWLVLPDGSFCTVGDDEFHYFHRGSIPGLPEDDNATCVVGSTGAWLVLDCAAADEDHCNYLLGKICGSCFCCILDANDVKRKPSYRLHNPFSGATVPLPELDSVITSVTRKFQIRKVLMRSPDDTGDVIAVVTNNWNYNIILCRLGKGTNVLSYYRIIDVAFLGDWLYGITPDEDLFAFQIAEDDDGAPIVTKRKRIIKNPLPEGNEDYWSWVEEEEEEEEEGGNNDDGGGDGGSDNDNDEVVSNSTNEEGGRKLITKHKTKKMRWIAQVMKKMRWTMKHKIKKRRRIAQVMKMRWWTMEQKTKKKRRIAQVVEKRRMRRPQLVMT
ncbi:unnamed protein product [Urochloa humidicola]